MGAEAVLLGIIAFAGILTLVGMFAQEDSNKEKTYYDEDISEDHNNYDEPYDEYATEDYDYATLSGISDDIYGDDVMYEDDVYEYDDVTDPAYCYLDYNIYHSLCDTDLDDDISTHDSYDDDHYWLDNDNWYD